MEAKEDEGDGLRLKSDFIPGTFNIWALGQYIVPQVEKNILN